MNTNNNNNNFLNIENMLPINLSELDFQFGDDYIVDTRPIMYTRSTCEYRPENDMYDPRMDILTLDPYLTANPVLEAYDARLEQAFMEEDQDNDANLDQVFMEEDQAGEIYDPRFDILDMDLDDPYFAVNPDFEALDAKLEQDDEDEDDDDDEEYDDELDQFNREHGTCFPLESYEKLKEYAMRNMITLRDAIHQSQSCHACNSFFEQNEYTDYGYGNLYCCDTCENDIEVYDQLCYSRYKVDCMCCDDTVCAICSNPDKVALFNSKFDVQDFDEETIQLTKDYARENQLTIREAMEQLSCCHTCGNTEITYGDIYCSHHCAKLESECENLIATEDAANLDIWMDTENLDSEDDANLDGWMDI